MDSKINTSQVALIKERNRTYKNQQVNRFKYK